MDLERMVMVGCGALILVLLAVVIHHWLNTKTTSDSDNVHPISQTTTDPLIIMWEQIGAVLQSMPIFSGNDRLRLRVVGSDCLYEVWRMKPGSRAEKDLLLNRIKVCYASNGDLCYAVFIQNENSGCNKVFRQGCEQRMWGRVRTHIEQNYLRKNASIGAERAVKNEPSLNAELFPVSDLNRLGDVVRQ